MRMFGRRTWGFLVIAITMLLLYAPTPEKYRWVNLALAGLAFFWCLMFEFEDVGRWRREQQRRMGGESR